ncbi:MAG: type II toxin-antitoxin system HicB family antitoxin [Chloroflexi bacterium]|nr:type II toxin-antitoxin system HicB family antitoxin [Chloroflexota bacterium]MBI3733463.1 type II toxin-antitoxin system HicB family antitoxin [Chloroflexota bacterium]
MKSTLIHRYRVIFEREPDGGYAIHCPSLKGCHSQGDTYEEALENIREAMTAWLEVARDFGDPIPPSDVLEETLVEVTA